MVACVYVQGIPMFRVYDDRDIRLVELLTAAYFCGHDVRVRFEKEDVE